MTLHRWTLTAALLAASPAVHADNALRPERIPKKARELADRGRAFHDAGDYTAAVSAFKEAYVLAPSPSLLFNIAQSYRLDGKCDESAWMYRRFLDTDPAGAQRTLAEQHLSSVERCGSGGLRMIEPPKLDAKVREPETQATTEIHRDVVRVQTTDNRSHKLKRYGVVSAIGGGAALIGAAVFAVDAADAANTVEETYRRGGKWSDVAAIDARGRRSSTIATGLGVGGGIAAAAGALMFAVGRHYETAERIAITPSNGGGAQVSLSWGF